MIFTMQISTPTHTDSTEAQFGVNAEKAAKMLDCGKTTIYDLAREGQLASYKLGKRGLRITMSSIQEFVERGGFEEDQGLGLSAEVRIARNKALANKGKMQWRRK